MGFSWQEYWSGLPFPSPGDLPNPGTEPESPCVSSTAGGFFTAEPPGNLSLQMAHFMSFCGEYPIMYAHHILIHSSADGRLVGFHVLAAVNSAAISIGVHVSFGILVFSRGLPRSGIAGSYVSATLNFLGTSTLFSIVVVSLYIPTNNVGGFPFLHTPSSISFFFFSFPSICYL